MANKKKKKNENWFDRLCAMGSDSENVKNDKKSTSGAKKATKKNTRVRVENRSSDPYDGFNDADIPPFDDTEEPTVAQSLFGDGGAPAGEIPGNTTPRTRTSRSRSTGGSSAGGTGSRSSAGKRSPSGGGKGAKQSPVDEPRKPAELVYFLRPYVLFVLGVLLAVEMLLSFFMSGGAFDWTADTHPFRLIGYYLEYFLFGMLGYGAYLVPAFVMYLSYQCIRHKKLFRSAERSIPACVLAVLLPAIIHVCQVNGGAENVPNTLAIKELYTAAGGLRAGAGVLGGLLAYAANVGLGVIGTVLVGLLLAVLFTVLLLGMTPVSAWQKLRTYARERAERREEYDEREEQKRLAREERRLLPPPDEEKRTPRKTKNDAQELPALPDSKEIRRAAREQERRQAEALREAERSDRMEQGGKRTKKVPQPVLEDTAENEDDFDPTEALIGRERVVPELIRKDTPTVVETDEGEDQEAEAVFGVIRELPTKEDDTPTVIARASDLPEQDDDIPAFEEEDKEQSGVPQVYPAHSEIELDLDAPIPEEDAVSDEDDVTSMFRPGLLSDDEPATEPVAQDDEEVDPTLQGEGGVTIHVEKLSEEERMRGEKMAEKAKAETAPVRPYQFPPVDMLEKSPDTSEQAEVALQRKAIRLRDTLSSFNVKVEAVSYVGGPTVTRYEVKPAPGVRVRSIAALADDIAMGLEAAGAIRIEAPIPGKNAVGIEVPNEDRSTVYLRNLIDSDAFRASKSRLTCSLGEGVGGIPVYLDISKMPHLLIAGATGTGKSVCINSLIMSLLYKAKPDEVKLIMIDPKTVEFSVYKDIPHLMAPILCDAKRSAGALNLAVQEMERRYEQMRRVGVRKIEDYNLATVKDRYEYPYIPHIVIIIDELADLMMTAKNEVEASIVRLAQKARAAGIHLILGTQRPSVDVITGLIKANVPSRIAFTVTSQIDSRTILDNAGAEKLVGKGDMLYAPIGSSKPQRVQGCFVTDGEVERIVDYIRRKNDPVKYDEEFLINLDREAELIGNKKGAERDDDDEEREPGDLDPKFYEALGVAVKNKRISTSLLQRAISVGYGRAAKILDQMEEKGFISEASGNKPRDILISEEAYRELMAHKDE